MIPFVPREVLARIQARLEIARLHHEARAQTQQLTAIFEALTDILTVYDREGRLVYFNTAMREQLALSRQPDYTTRPLIERFSELHPTDTSGCPLPPDAWPHARILRGETLTGPKAMEVLIHTFNGRTIWLAMTGAPIRDESGQITGAVLVSRDVTMQRQMEQAKHQADASYRSIVQTTNEGIWFVDLRARTLYANDRMVALLGTTSESLTNRTVLEYVFPEDLSLAQERITSNLNGNTEQFDFRFRRTDGSRVEVLACTSPMRDSQGTIVGALGMFTDITKRKQTEMERQQFVSLVEHSSDFISMSTLTGDVIYVNPAGCHLVGLPDDQATVLTTRISDYLPEEFQQRFAESIMPTVLATGRWEGEVQFRHFQTGQLIDIYQKIFFIEDAAAPLCLAIIARDIREQKDLERRKDTFIGMASHELRTPITTIKGNIQLAERQVSRLLRTPEILPTETQEALKKVSMLLSRALHQTDVQNRLIGDLLDVSRIQENKLELSPELCDLVTLVCEAVEDQRASTPDRSIVFDAPCDVSMLILADADRIGQVINNYLSNALKYSPADQPVVVGLSVEKPFVRVWVQDKGPGLSLEQQQHVWERFYQATGIAIQNGASHGLGLGLHICQTVIKQHNGEVGVNSTPGHGSTFWFMLPLAEPASIHE